MTATELGTFVRGIAPVLRAQIAKTTDKALAGMQDRLATLEQRVAAVRDGAHGKDGDTGPPGAAGATGEKGDPGPIGARGEAGLQGDMGPQGLPGPPGASGEHGLDGPAGDPGPIGDRGDVGPQGDGAKGDSGPQGPTGPQGVPGEHGQDGPSGRDGRDGLPGVPGSPGEKGLDGRHGVDGVNGADGLGFDDVEAVYDEYGRMSLRFVRGDRVKEFRVPGIVDRGTYKADAAYESGDAVTYGGAFWIAQHATGAKPGDPGPESRAWRLAVKSGRDGRDARPR